MVDGSNAWQRRRSLAAFVSGYALIADSGGQGMYKAIAVGLLLVVASSADAKIDSLGKASAGALNVESPFESQRLQILKDLDGGEKYSEISKQDAEKVKGALGRMSQQLASADGTLSRLNADQLAVVFNDQELVNAILTQAGEESRLVCTRERPVGSRRPVTHCMTVAEKRRHREESQNEMDKNFRTLQFDDNP
jgi:hypothetical protein